MATVHVDDDSVEIRLTWWEHVAGLLRDQRIAVADIVEAEAVADPQRAVRGLRAPGLSVPGVSRIGTWRLDGTRVFVCVRGQGPALRLVTRTGRFRTYLVTSDDAAELASHLTTPPRT